MSYDKKYRQRTIEYRQEGHTLEETSRVFKVSVSTILNWAKLCQETGGYDKRPLNRSYKKIDPVRLASYVAEHPDAYLTEIGEVFFCGESAVRKALKKLGITRKKRRSVTENKTLSR
jgi:Transposase.